MAEAIYQHEHDGQEVEEEDINLLGQTAGLADDRVLAELLRLAPFDGTNTAKAILPYALRAGDSATVVPNGASGSVRILPFRAIIGSRTGIAADPLAAWRDIRSSVYAQTTGSGAFGAAAVFAPNTTALPRWDLVYAAFTPDANGASRTRYVRDPATGAISSPTVVTTRVQNVVAMVLQGTPAAAPIPPAPPADGGGTYYIPLAYVAIEPSFSATSTILPQSILSVAPVVSLARTAGSFAVQPANQQYVPNGAAITAARLGTWGVSAANRPGFFLPPEMVGGESRIFAIDFTIQGWSHSLPMAVADDSRDWRNRVFRCTCFARGMNGALNPGFAWQTPAVNLAFMLPTARAAGVGQDIQFGFGQSFQADAGDRNGATAFLVNPSPPATNPGQMTGIPDTVGLMVDMVDGKLRVYTRLSANPNFAIFIWLDASAPFPNWA